ncbi:MAG: hypothetical protein V7754_22270 [Halioglobus sp.]
MARKLILMLALVVMYGCQSKDTAEIEVLRTQLAVLEHAVNEDSEICKSLSAELGQLKQDSIDFDADYSEQQAIIEQQDARYNELLTRWEQQAGRMDKILGAQERQHGVSQ